MQQWSSYQFRSDIAAHEEYFFECYVPLFSVRGGVSSANNYWNHNIPLLTDHASVGLRLKNQLCYNPTFQYPFPETRNVCPSPSVGCLSYFSSIVSLLPNPTGTLTYLSVCPRRLLPGHPQSPVGVTCLPSRVESLWFEQNFLLYSRSTREI